MTFNASCVPGPAAAVGFRQLSQDVYTLVMYLDPESLTLQTPPFPDGNRVFAKLLRELSREADKLAELIDPTDGGRHSLPADFDTGDSGGR